MDAETRKWHPTGEMKNRRTRSSLPGLPSSPPGAQWPSTIWEAVRDARDGPPCDRKHALDRLTILYYKPVYRFFERVFGARGHRLKDVTQDFFTKFLGEKFFRGLKVEKSLRTWLKVACRNHYINWCKSEKVRQVRDLHDPPPVAENEFSEMLDEEIRASYVNEGMKRLKRMLLNEGKESHGKVFEARVKDKDKDYKTLARDLGRSILNVRKSLAYSRRLFRELLLKLASECTRHPKTELRELGLMR